MPCTKIPTSIFIDIYRSDSEPVLRSKLEYWFGMFGRWKRQIYKLTKNKLIQSTLNTFNFLPTTENNQAVHNKFI